jgi:hypothetical protein
MVMATPTPSVAPAQSQAHRGLPPGISRDPWMLRLLGFDGFTVDPDSPGAAALRQTEHYRDAYREGEAWSRAEIAAGPAVHRGTRPDPGGLDIFALNATANGWLIGEKLEAIGYHSPQVPANQMEVLRRQGREPLDLEGLWRYIDERGVHEPMSTSVFLGQGDPLPTIRQSGAGGGRTASVDPAYGQAVVARQQECEHHGYVQRLDSGYTADDYRAMARGAQRVDRQREGVRAPGVRAPMEREREEIDTEEFER